ncbi:7660_t:CDS:2, partial [Racocetra fulgida]
MSYGDIYSYYPEKLYNSVGHERRESEIKQIIQSILKERLEKAIYDKDQAPGWAHEIAEGIKAKLL